MKPVHQTNNCLSGFLDAITNSAPGQWKVLVVDEHAKRLLGANLKEADILSERVTGTYYCGSPSAMATVLLYRLGLRADCVAAIDLITSFRAPEPNMDAIYLLMPTTQNIDRIIRDFTDKQTYAGAWLHFTDRECLRRVLCIDFETYYRNNGKAVTTPRAVSRKSLLAEDLGYVYQFLG